MKKLFSVISLVLVAAFLFVATEVFAAPQWQSSPGAGDIMGNGRGLISAPHKTFRLVRYMPRLSDVALVAGDVVVWSDSASGDDGVTVTTTTLSSDSKIAGVCVTAIPLPTSGTVYKDGSAPNSAADDKSNENWGWLQTYGLCDVNMGAGDTPAAGDALGTSVTPGKAGGFLPSTTLENHNGYGGFFLDAAAASATGVDAFIKCE